MTNLKLQQKLKLMKSHRYLYLLVLPGVAFFFIFKYIPIYGIQLAFREFKYYENYSNMPWRGLEYFTRLVLDREFWRAFRNTLVISSLKIIFGFPVPIIIALLLSEVRFKGLKRFSQTVLTFPHFLSWVVLAGVFFNLMGQTGVLNTLLSMAGLPKVNFLFDRATFRGLLIFSEIWKEAGWSSIVYLAAITSIGTAMYEAADIDGASRFQKVLYITLPSIMSIAVVMLILRVGRIINENFLQVFMLYTPPTYEVGDVIETYIYRITFQRPPDFSFSTAVGVFKGILNLILLMTANGIAKKLGHRGIY